MTGKDLLEAMSLVDEKYVDEAESKHLKRGMPLTWLSMAACLCILICGAMFWLQPEVSNDGAVMENAAAGEMIMDEELTRTEAALGDEDKEMPPEYSMNSTENVDFNRNGEPCLTLRIDAWEGDGFVATVYGQRNTKEYPFGTVVKVFFAEKVWADGEYRQPTEDDYPVKNMVEVLFYPCESTEGENVIVVEAIILMPAPGETGE